MTHDRLDSLIDSLEKITARVLETSIANSQLASSATPEMRRLFGEWISCIEEEIIRIALEEKMLDVAHAAESIGVTRETFLSIVLTLMRKGKLEVKKIELEEGNGKSKDICDCLD